MDQKEIFMLSLSSDVYFAVAADRHSLACNNQMREAVEGTVQFVCRFILHL